MRASIAEWRSRFRGGLQCCANPRGESSRQARSRGPPTFRTRWALFGSGKDAMDRAPSASPGTWQAFRRTLQASPAMLHLCGSSRSAELASVEPSVPPVHRASRRCWRLIARSETFRRSPPSPRRTTKCLGLRMELTSRRGQRGRGWAGILGLLLHAQHRELASSTAGVTACHNSSRRPAGPSTTVATVDRGRRCRRFTGRLPAGDGPGPRRRGPRPSPPQSLAFNEPPGDLDSAGHSRREERSRPDHHPQARCIPRSLAIPLPQQSPPESFPPRLSAEPPEAIKPELDPPPDGIAPAALGDSTPAPAASDRAEQWRLDRRGKPPVRLLPRKEWLPSEVESQSHGRVGMMHRPDDHEGHRRHT